MIYKRKKNYFILTWILLFTITINPKANYINDFSEPFPIKITAYCHCKKCCNKDDGITASGRPVKQGLTVASDTYYGKMIIIYDEDMNLYGIFECMDKGVKHIDIYFESHQTAKEFGVKQWYIQVVDAKG